MYHDAWRVGTRKVRNQVKIYLDSEEVKQWQNMKSWVIVFMGEKAEVIEERGNEDKKNLTS